jgi:MFS family permease
MYLVMLVAEYPQNYIISKAPLAKYLGFCMMCEGFVVASHAACVNFTGLIIGRCLLGIFEAACQPCLVLISVMWYRKEEQVVRIPIWYVRLIPCSLTYAPLTILKVHDVWGTANHRRFPGLWLYIH